MLEGNSRNEEGTFEDYRARVLRVLVYIQQNLDGALTLEELAACAHFSPFHFHRIFRGLVGPGAGVLSQFAAGHAAGKVADRWDAAASNDKTFVFVSESIENIPAGWRARESDRILNNDEFIEVSELAAPGKEFESYSESYFRQKK